MRTDKYVTSQVQLIDGKIAEIARLEALIKQLRDEIRNDSQIRQARETANNELRGLLGQFKSLLGDMAGLFRSMKLTQT